MAILQDQWKLSKSGESVTLYDLVADPLEVADLTGQKPELEARLSKAMAPFVEMLAKGSGRTFRPGGAGWRALRRGGRPARRGAVGAEGASEGEARRPKGRRPGRPGGRPGSGRTPPGEEEKPDAGQSGERPAHAEEG
jgi:hypothetical protein